MRRAPALLALALAAGDARGEGGWDLEAEVGGGADTNPERVAGMAASPEGFAAVLGRARWDLDAEGGRLAARLAFGGRLYPGRPGASALAGRVDADGRLELSGPLAAGAAVAASDLAEGDGRLDQRSLRGEAGLRWEPGGWSASLAAGYSLLDPLESSLVPFRSRGPEAWLRGTWSPAAGHALAAAAGVASASYPRWRDVAPEGRRDTALTVQVGWSLRGPVLAALGWTFTRNASSAAGGDFVRHRATASCAAPLPRGLSLALRAALQWSHYPEPLFLSEQLLLAQGGESQNAVEARVTVPLAGPWEVALSWAQYWSESVRGGTAPAFSRGVGSVALAWRSR